jgi:CHAT domain-containing protein
VAWLSTRGGTTAKALTLTGAEISRLADRYRRLAARGLTLAATRSTAQDLYRALVQPIEPSLTGIRELVVVADPALAGVSFAALNNPASGTYLIESMSVAMAPSATLASTPAVQVAKSEALLVGADRPQSMPPLPWVAKELDDLRSIYPQATVLTGNDATRERLLNGAPRASVIHIAGHAFGSPVNPLVSRLILHPGMDGRSDLYAYELSSLDVSGALVVLAACRTGYAGRDLADDDGVLALARPFLARGARAVVATYRDVSDRGAPVLMQRFHRHVQEGMSPSRAWQATAIDSLRDGGESAEWTAYGVFLGRGALAATPAGRLTNE